MSSYYSSPPPQYPPSSGSAQNLQFYPSSYASVSGHTTPSQAYGSPPYGASSNAYPGGSYGGGAGAGFGAGGPGFGTGAPGFGGGVSGRMGEQGGLRTGWLAAFGTEGYEGEPPLLEELGVNFGHIKMKTLTVLNPLRPVPPHIMDDSDLAGPILFFLLFGTFLAVSGSLHFGYIYGLALVGSTLLHVILSLMSPLPSPSSPSSTPAPHSQHHHSSSAHFQSSLTFPRTSSILGYCLLPLVLTSLLGTTVPMDTALGYSLFSLTAGWCTYSSSGMFVAVGRMRGMRGLVAYPLGLFYASFGIMGVFGSRGGGGGLGGLKGS